MSDIVDQFNVKIDESGVQILTKKKLYRVELTTEEMQMTANGIAAFMNVMNREKRGISPPQIAHLINVMNKFKDAIAQNKYRIIEEI